MAFKDPNEQKAYDKEWYEKNKDRILAKQKAHRAANLDKIRTAERERSATPTDKARRYASTTCEPFKNSDESTSMLYDEDDSPLRARLYPKPKVLPFEYSAARADDITVCMAACAHGRETITVAGARQWAKIEKDRITNAEKRQRAKVRYEAKKASRKAARSGD